MPPPILRGAGPLATSVAAAFLLAPPLEAQDAVGGGSRDASAVATGSASVVIEAEDYAFDAPDEIQSGWNTIRYVNTGDEAHFLLFSRMPEGKDVEDYQTDVVRAFDEGWQALRAGEIGQEEALDHIIGGVSEWFWEVEFVGGTGIVHEGDATEVTLDLEPGTYVIECYMKTEDGELHTVEGMIRELTVTEMPSTEFEPEPDAEVTLSNFAMDVEGDLEPGRQTVAVHVEEQPEEGFGHNVHVVRDDEADPDEVLRWLNYLEIDGMVPPAPYTFLGGMHVLPEGETGYFNVDLEPGRHLFLSEFTGVEGVMQEVIVEP